MGTNPKICQWNPMNIGKMKFDLVELGVGGSPFRHWEDLSAFFWETSYLCSRRFFKTKTHSWNCCNRGEQPTMCSLFLETQAIQFWSLLQCSIVPKCFVLSVGIEVRICEYPTDLNPGPTDWEIPVFLVPKTAVDPYSPYEQLVAH